MKIQHYLDSQDNHIIHAGLRKSAKIGFYTIQVHAMRLFCIAILCNNTHIPSLGHFKVPHSRVLNCLNVRK